MIAWEPLFAKILEHPFDDAPRLVAADWLQENGDEARAEFVRVQCELEKFKGRCGRTGKIPWCSAPECRGCFLRHRELGLLEQYGREWAKSSFGGAWEFGRGGTNQFDAHRSGHPQILFSVGFNRGFVYYATLAAGRFLGLIRNFALSAPLTGFNLSDCSPYETDDEGPSVYAWCEQTRRDWAQERSDGGTPSSAIGSVHKDLFQHLRPHPKFKRNDLRWNKSEPDNRRWTYPTEAAALQALSRAAVTLCREKAGLPAMVWPDAPQPARKRRRL